MRVNGPKTNFTAPLAAPLAARVILPFHLHAKRNFGKNKVKFVFSKV